MKKKKRKIRIFRLLIVFLIPVLVVYGIIFIINSNKPTSIHDDALTYENKGCLIFYPDNDDIKEYAMSYCEEDKEEVVDYEINSFGDYISIDYPSGKSFILDENYDYPSFEIADKKILSNVLRYEYKKSENDEAYTSKFLEESYYDTFDVGDIKISIDKEKTTFNFLKYNFSFDMSLGLAQVVLDANFGVENEDYVNKSYVSSNRPVIALTYDDGPYYLVDLRLFDIFDKYDSRCTFFSVGNRYYDAELENARIGLSLGNEYGSHSYDHSYLNRLSFESAYNNIMQPVNLFKEEFGYDMKVYRFPGGNVNRNVLNALDLRSVMWTVDTEDWRTHDANSTYNEIMSARDGDIVLMHSLYVSSADATEMAVPALIDKGYQLVTVSECLNH